MSRGTVAVAVIASLALLLVIASTRDGNHRDTALLQQHVITIPPSGYVVKEGKAIHAMLDIAAPIDSSTSASIPGIVIPRAGSVAQAADPRQQLAASRLQALASSANPYAATAGAMQAAAQGGAAASEVQGARQQQLEEEDEEPSMADGDEDMFPETESEGYAEQEPEDIVPHKTIYNYNYAAPNYGPAPAEEAVGGRRGEGGVLGKDLTTLPGSLVKHIPNFFVSPFQRWHDEDAAQHAYNLQQWRVKILQAKVRQAELHKQLSGLDEKKEARLQQKRGIEPQEEEEEEEEEGSGASARARGGGMQKLRSETGKELKDIERQMLTLAKVTEKAIQERSAAGKHGGGGGGWGAGERSARREKFMAETKAEIAGLKHRVASLQKRLKSRGPAALQDAVAPSSLPSGVPSQVALWQRINSDVKA